MPNLYELSQEQQDILDELFFDPENQDLHEKLSKINGDAKDKLSYMAKLYLEADAVAEGRKLVVARADKRAKEAKNTADRLKTLIFDYMMKFDIGNIKTEEASMRIDPGREKLIVKESIIDYDFLLNNGFCSKEEVYKIDKRALAQYIKDDHEITGAFITKEPFIVIR